MRTIRQVNIKNRQNDFFNDMTNISDFDSSLLNANSLKLKSSVTIIYDIKNLNCSNSLYLVFNNLDAKI